VNAILRTLIVWLTLLALPLQGFASATMSLCVLPAAAAHDVHAPAHGHVQPTAAAVRGERHPGGHHQSGKCASCAACCPCLPLAPSFLAVPPATLGAAITAPFDQRLLPSVHLALPERPPRA
jgi:hypothetical protein